MHDTVGIIYQFLSSDKYDVEANQITERSSEDEENSTEKNSDDCRPARKRRKFDELLHNEQRSYIRKPVSDYKLLPYDTFLNTLKEFDISRSNAIKKDVFWSMCFSQIENVPMWIGFGKQTTVDDSEMQTVQYLSQINASPTSLAVVRETLETTSKIAERCKQPYIIVSYDLAIAKLAHEIKLTETPKFDNIFVNLGGFHFTMAYFKAVGKVINSCGIVDILTQAEVLAGGSINSFISSKHFNRCKRLHPIVSAALQTMQLYCEFRFKSSIL